MSKRDEQSNRLCKDCGHIKGNHPKSVPVRCEIFNGGCNVLGCSCEAFRPEKIGKGPNATYVTTEHADPAPVPGVQNIVIPEGMFE